MYMHTRMHRHVHGHVRLWRRTCGGQTCALAVCVLVYGPDCLIGVVSEAHMDVCARVCALCVRVSLVG